MIRPAIVMNDCARAHCANARGYWLSSVDATTNPMRRGCVAVRWGMPGRVTGGIGSVIISIVVWIIRGSVLGVGR